MQANAPSKVQDWQLLLTLPKSLKLMKLTPASPDIYPIENFWSIIKRFIWKLKTAFKQRRVIKSNNIFAVLYIIKPAILKTLFLKRIETKTFMIVNIFTNSRWLILIFIVETFACVLKPDTIRVSNML